MDTIRAMLEEHFRDRMATGAGTAVNPAQVELMCQAKTAYIISSNVSEAVIRRTKGLGMLFIPGALSPGKMLNTHGYGADHVKLPPAARMTASYIKDLMGPISHVKFVATAGITEENIAEFVTVGCTDYGTNGRLMDKRVIQEGRLGELQHRAEALVAYLQEKEE